MHTYIHYIQISAKHSSLIDLMPYVNVKINTPTLTNTCILMNSLDHTLSPHFLKTLVCSVLCKYLKGSFHFFRSVNTHDYESIFGLTIVAGIYHQSGPQLLCTLQSPLNTECVVARRL